MTRLVFLMAGWLLLTGCDEPFTGYPGYVEGEFLYMAAPSGGRLVSRPLERGDQVTAGDSLFRIDRAWERAALQEAEHRVERARAAYADLTTGKRPEEIQVIRTQLAQATASARLAQTKAERARGLFASGSIPKSQLDDAEAELDRANARVEEMESSIVTAELPARTDAQKASRQELLAAIAAAEQARWAWDEKAPTAPGNALVQDVYYHEGEWVPAGSPVISLLPPENRKIRFFVPEADVAGFHEGDRVTITCDGCGAPIEARVSYVAPEAEFTPPIIYSLDQRSKLVFRVEAHPAVNDAERLRPGLPVSVESGAPSSNAPSSTSTPEGP